MAEYKSAKLETRNKQNPKDKNPRATKNDPKIPDITPTNSIIFNMDGV